MQNLSRTWKPALVAVLLIALAATTARAQESPGSVPGLAHAQGANGALFTSDLVLLFTPTVSESRTVTFHPNGGGTPVMRSIVFQPGEMPSYPDMVKTFFGLDPAAGALTITPARGIVAYQRTANTKDPKKTFGSSIEMRRDLVLPGQIAHAIPVIVSDVFRTNAALTVIGGPIGASAVAQMYRDDGSPVGIPIRLTVAPDTVLFRQWSLAEFIGPGVKLPLGRMQVDVRRGSADGYLSIVDNTSNDSTVTRITSIAIDATTQFINGQGANSSGIGGSLWNSTVWIYNPHSEPLDVRHEFHGNAPAGVATVRTIRIEAGQTIEEKNILSEVFGYTIPVSGGLKLSASRPFLAVARTSNEDPTRAGTFAATQEAIPLERIVRGYGTIIGLKQDEDWRSNLRTYAITATSGHFDMYDRAGRFIASKPFSQPANSWVQQSIPALFPGAPPYFRIDVVRTNGVVDAEASVIDNASGDPMTVREANIDLIAPGGIGGPGGPTTGGCTAPSILFFRIIGVGKEICGEQDITFEWNTLDADRNNITPLIGLVGPFGTRTERVPSTTTFQLDADNACARRSATDWIVVSPGAPTDGTLTVSTNQACPGANVTFTASSDSATSATLLPAGIPIAPGGSITRPVSVTADWSVRFANTCGSFTTPLVRVSVDPSFCGGGTPSVSISASSDGQICPGGSVTITAVASNLSAPITYELFLNGSLVASQSAAAFTVTTPGTYRVDAAGAGNVRVQSNLLNVVSAQPLGQGTISVSPNPVGFGQSAQVTGTVSGAISLQFSGPGAPSAPLPGPTASFTTPALTSDAVYSVVGINGCGQTSTAVSTTVFVQPLGCQNPPQLLSMAVNPLSVPASSGPVTFTLATQNVASVTLNPGNQALDPNGSTTRTLTPGTKTLRFFPTDPLCTSFTTTIVIGTQTGSCQTPVVLGAFSFTPNAVPAGGGQVTITTSGTNATSIVLTPGNVPVTPNAAFPVTLTPNMYTLVYTGPDANCPTGTLTFTVGLTGVCTVPDSTITAPSSVCPSTSGNTASVSNSGAGTVYTWNIANGTITSGQNTTDIVFTAGATGLVSLTAQVNVSCGLTSTSSIIVPIGTPPVATITAPSSVCPASTGNQASTPNAGNNAQYSWSILNGTLTGGLNTPDVTFTAGATGNVSLSVTITNGCSLNASDTVLVPIGTTPSAQVTMPTTLCPNAAGNLASTPNAGNGATYNWTITNGFITAGLASPDVVFTAGPSGLTTLNVTVTNACGLSASGSASGSIGTTPTALIAAPGSLCPNAAGNTATVPNAGNNAQYVWAITNGTIDAGLNTDTITFTAGATGSVSLGVTVTNACGLSASDSVVIPIGTAPPVQITAPASVCPSTSGNAASTPNAGNNALYVWGITNGTIDTGLGTENITFTSGPNGNVQLTVNVTNTCALSASDTATVAIGTAPAAQITMPLTVCTGSTGNQATVANAGANATYTWTLANGTITAGQNTDTITFTAGATGTVDAQVTVMNACGLSASSSASSTIVAVSSTITAAASVCSLTINNPASVPPAVGATFVWTISNGTLTLGQNTNAVQYTAGASGSVVLTVTVAASGCSRTSTQTIPINPLPVVVVTAPAFTCASSAGNQASVVLGAGESVLWTITNGTITSLTNANPVVYTAGAIGQTVVNATVTNSNGCQNSDSAAVTINAAPVVIAPAAYCSMSQSTASVNARPGATYAWTVGGATVVGSPNGPLVTFNVGATGPITLQVTETLNGITCTSTVVSVPVTTTPDAAFTPPLSACIGAATTISVPAQPGIILWSATNATTGATNGTSFTFTPNGNGPVTVNVSVANGACTDTDSAVIPVAAAPTAAIAVVGSNTLCQNTAATVRITCTGTGCNDWSVALSNGTVRNNITVATADLTFPLTASGPVTGTITSACGTSPITGSVTFTMTTVPAAATITATPNPVIPGNASAININAPGATSIAVTQSVNSGPFTPVIGSPFAGTSASFSTGPLVNGTTVTYVAIPSNACGAGASSTVTVTAVAPACSALAASTFANGGTNTYCEGQTRTFTITPAGGTAPYTVVIRQNGIVVQSSPGIAEGAPVTYTTSAALAPGTYTYDVTINDSAGCAITLGPTVVTVNAVPVVAITRTGNPPSPTASCANGNGTASVVLAGGDTVLWTGTNLSINGSATVTPVSFTAGASGTATLTATVTNANGCSTSASQSYTIDTAGVPAMLTFTINGSINPAPIPAGSDVVVNWTSSPNTLYCMLSIKGRVVAQNAAPGTSVKLNLTADTPVDITPFGACGPGPTQTIPVDVQ